MYWNILKRDLKRKKTMNVILLLFTVIASMFVSSGVSNVISVMNGTDHYLDMAGVGDYIVITQNGDGGVEQILKDSSNVSDYRADYCYLGSLDKNIKINGKKIKNKNDTALFQKLSDNGLTFFRQDNSELEKVSNGEVYITVSAIAGNNIQPGDTVEVEIGDFRKTFTVAGGIKDALLGSDMMGNTRFIFSDEDYEEFDTEELRDYKGAVFCIDSDDDKAVSGEISECPGLLFSSGRSLIKLSYVMEMLVAMIVLVLSVCLCIVSFVLLKFVITFTINEEYREIGVMKAIGIRNFKIRSIYMIKYFVMALIGGIIGFFAGIPFGKLLIKSVSQKMVLANDFGILMNIAGAVIVIAVMSEFAYICTAKVKKSTPVDAIRNGATGERYSKKTKFSIVKSGFGNEFSMALNDVLSAPKRFLTIIISFFLCSVFVFGLVEVTDTMKSDRLINTFCVKSDAYIDMSVFGGLDLLKGNRTLDEMLDGIEDDLEKLDMPGKATVEVWYKYKTEFDEQSYSLIYQQNKSTSAGDYVYTKGSAPQNANEIAVTNQISEQTGAKIGDVISVDFGTEKRDCIITGYFQTMNQLGSVLRLHEDAPTDMQYASSLMAIQITFNDNPGSSVTDERIEKLKDFYDTDDIMNSAEYCADCIGVVDTMNTVSKLLLLITCIVVVLVTVLMEHSFISDERSQIALLKAIGFKNSSIIRWQVYRFMIIAAVSEFFAAILTYPVTKLWCDPVWSMMGATDVNYFFNPVSLLVVYPGIIMLITLLSVWITAGCTKSITCNDVGNVE